MRQMKEYKRQSRDFENQYNDLVKKCKYHDDHLRTIDAWFAQLLDEVRVLASEALPTPPPSASSTNGMTTPDLVTRQKHLLRLRNRRRHVRLHPAIREQRPFLQASAG